MGAKPVGPEKGLGFGTRSCITGRNKQMDIFIGVVPIYFCWQLIIHLPLPFMISTYSSFRRSTALLKPPTKSTTSSSFGTVPYRISHSETGTQPMCPLFITQCKTQVNHPIFRINVQPYNLAGSAIRHHSLGCHSPLLSPCDIFCSSSLICLLLSARLSFFGLLPSPLSSFF